MKLISFITSIHWMVLLTLNVLPSSHALSLLSSSSNKLRSSGQHQIRTTRTTSLNTSSNKRCTSSSSSLFLSNSISIHRRNISFQSSLPSSSPSSSFMHPFSNRLRIRIRTSLYATINNQDESSDVILTIDDEKIEKEEKKKKNQQKKKTTTTIKHKNNDIENENSTHTNIDTNTIANAKSEKQGKETQKKEMKSVSARYVYDNDLSITTDEDGRVTARPKDSNEKGLEEGAVVKDKHIKSNKPSKKQRKGKKKKDDVVSKSNHNTAKTTKKQPRKNKNNKQSNNTRKKLNQDEKNDSENNDDDEKRSNKVTLTAATKTSSSSSSKIEQAVEKVTTPSVTQSRNTKPLVVENVPKPVIAGEFNVVLTHCTADFDSLASAVGLAKLWSSPHPSSLSPSSSSSSSSSTNISSTTKSNSSSEESTFVSTSILPTFVVLPRGAHPSVQRFLGLHKHLFPIRSLRSLPKDLGKLHRLGLVDAQRRDRVGPAEILLGNADRVTIVDHHIDGESDIPEATDYVIDKVGSVSTMVAEQLRDAGFELTEAEATLLALGIHADTGSLCYDSTTSRDAEALAWVMKQGASQAAIAENCHASLSQEQQGVLTNCLVNTNSTMIHGVTVSTVLLSADGFINGLAAVTQDALELSSSDVFLLAVVYYPKSGGKGKRGKKGNDVGIRLQSEFLQADEDKKQSVMEAEAWKGAWKGGEEALKMRKLRAAFDKKDGNGNGFLEKDEIFKALANSGVIASQDAVESLMETIDSDGDGKIDFDEFVAFSEKAEEIQKEKKDATGRQSATMIVIGRVKAGVNMKNVNLNRLFQQFGGGGHAKAASCTVRLEDESTAGQILQGLVDELIETGLMKQPTVGDFMTSPVLSAKPAMTEKQVEDLFVRYDVRALPVVDDNYDVVGLVTYKEVAAAKQRLWNKEQKRTREEAKKEAARLKKGQNDSASDKNEKRKNNEDSESDKSGEKIEARKLGSALKGWMKQHVKTVETSMTMAEVENILLENDVGCIPVVADGTLQLVGMVTRTDLLRQHRYYSTLHYNNKGFADSIAARKPIIELRKRLKKFDIEDE